MMALAYFNSYALPVIITRGNNVYGPRQVGGQAGLLGRGRRPAGWLGAGETEAAGWGRIPGLLCMLLDSALPCDFVMLTG